MLGLGDNIQNDKIPKRAYSEGSILLDGTNDFLKQNDGDNMLELISPASTSWSVSFYFMKVGSGATSTTILMNKTKTSGDLFWFTINNSNDLEIQSSYSIDGSVTIQLKAVWDTNFVKGTWYHVVITSDRSGTNSDTIAYIDGNVATRSLHTTTASNVDLHSNSNDAYFTMGTFNTDTTHFLYYNLHFDEIGVWNSVLSADEAEEIADKYPLLSQNVGAYASSANLLRYYRCGQDVSPTATRTQDQSGNAGIFLNSVNSPTTSTTTPY